MRITVPPEVENLINEKLRSGRYASAEEVVQEALHLLDDHDCLRELKLQRLRGQIAVGMEQANRGELVDGEEVFEEIRRKSNALQEHAQ